MNKLREETEKSDLNKKKQLLKDQNAGYGYGGKFGVEKDRMDKSAVGHDYQGKVDKHASQVDYSEGFGGKYGVQTNRVDKSAVGWDHIEKVEKHESQKGTLLELNYITYIIAMRFLQITPRALAESLACRRIARINRHWAGIISKRLRSTSRRKVSFC